ncbi:MAG: carboxypeptidase regulatory-like domain-containing protein, partial [Desulfobacterales bacterium]|nr:carboxypeptidase regulatory-like domain-containing protein [Desulfobacterales bacterium]
MNGTDEPAAGVWVNAWSDHHQSGAGAATDAAGKYTINGLTAVSADESGSKGYKVEIAAGDYPGMVFDGLVETGREDVDFNLETETFISGKVSEASGETLDGVKISAWSASDPGSKKGETVSGADGSYTIAGLPFAGDYIVAAYPADYTVQYYNRKKGSAEADKVDLTSGEKTGVDFVLDKGPLIKGAVYLENASTRATSSPPVIPAGAGVRVVVYSPSGGAGGDAETDAGGKYEITGLDAGTSDYIVSVRHDGYMAAFYHPSGTVHTRAEAGLVAPSTQNMDLTLIGGFTISGLISSEGEPVSGVRVEAESDGGFKARTESVAVTGGVNYAFTGIAPGAYEATVASTDHSPQTLQIVIADGDERLDFILDPLPAREISGVITGLAPGKTAAITVWSASADVSKTADLSGSDEPVSYTVPDLKPADDYLVELNAEDSPRQVYNNKNKMEDGDYVNLTEADVANVDFTISQDAFTIEGVVNFPDGAMPGESARVDVTSESLGVSAGVSVRAPDSLSAAYSITGLQPADDYIALVQSDGYPNHYYNGADGGAADPAEATRLNGSSDPVTVNFSLSSSGASISGRIKAPTRSAGGVSGITVEAWSESVGSMASAVTTPNGSFLIKGLAEADDYTLEFR